MIISDGAVTATTEKTVGRSLSWELSVMFIAVGAISFFGGLYVADVVKKDTHELAFTSAADYKILVTRGENPFTVTPENLHFTIAADLIYRREFSLDKIPLEIFFNDILIALATKYRTGHEVFGQLKLEDGGGIRYLDYQSTLAMTDSPADQIDRDFLCQIQQRCFRGQEQLKIATAYLENAPRTTFECVPPELITRELAEKKVREDPKELIYLPPDLKKEDLCRLALFDTSGNTIHPEAYQFVPLEIKTANNCALTWEVVERSDNIKREDVPLICLKPD